MRKFGVACVEMTQTRKNLHASNSKARRELNGRQSRTARRQAGYRILIRVRDDKKGYVLEGKQDTDTSSRY